MVSLDCYALEIKRFSDSKSRYVTHSLRNAFGDTIYVFFMFFFFKYIYFFQSRPGGCQRFPLVWPNLSFDGNSCQLYIAPPKASTRRSDNSLTRNLAAGGPRYQKVQRKNVYNHNTEQGWHIWTIGVFGRSGTRHVEATNNIWTRWLLMICFELVFMSF